MSEEIDPADFVDLFGPKTHEEKEENFEKSTLRMVLRQLGATPAQIRGWSASTPFDAEWFNELDVLNTRLYMKFFKRVSLMELVESPLKSELLQHWLSEVRASDDPAFLIYDTTHYKGRMVCTNIALPEIGHVHVVHRELKLNITPFPAFFTRRYGTCINGELDAQ